MLGLRRAEERRVANENMRLRLRVLQVIAESRKTDSPSFFTGFRFQQMGIRREHLLRVGLDIRALKQMGFNCWFMRWVGFELRDFVQEKMPIGFMLSGGFTRGRIESTRAWLQRQEKRKNLVQAR